MNKMFLALSAAALLVVTASSANAQYPAGPPAPGPIMPGGYGDMMYGGPGYGGHMGMMGGIPHGGGGGLLSGIFTNHGSHKRKGPIQRMVGGDDERARNAQMLPVATGGTLVFPQNPFVRSPRDFFMYYEGR